MFLRNLDKLRKEKKKKEREALGEKSLAKVKHVGYTLVGNYKISKKK